MTSKTAVPLIPPPLETISKPPDLRDLLAEDGSIWISIDDNEGHYLKVVADEIFGRKNFVANVVWQKIFSPKNTAKHFSEDHDHILVYAKDAENWRPNELPRSEKMNAN